MTPRKRSPRRRARRPLRRGTVRRRVYLISACCLGLAAIWVEVLRPSLVASAQSAGPGAGQRLWGFLDDFAGVFTLLTLTGSVLSGLVVSSRRALTPGRRVALQGAHRGGTILAVGLLATHVGVKIAEQDVSTLAAVFPFSGGASFKVGLGALAADLFVVTAATGVVRGRFARTARPALWRLLHSAAYVCWPLALVHGLTAGRAAAPWVVWTYGGCGALVVLALLVRALHILDSSRLGSRRRVLHARPPAEPSLAVLAELAVLSRPRERTTEPAARRCEGADQSTETGVASPPRRHSSIDLLCAGLNASRDARFRSGGALIAAMPPAEAWPPESGEACHGSGLAAAAHPSESMPVRTSEVFAALLSAAREPWFWITFGAAATEGHRARDHERS